MEPDGQPDGIFDGFFLAVGRQRVYDHVRQKLPELAPIPLPATAKQQPQRQQTRPPEGISEDDTQALERILRERLKEP